MFAVVMTGELIIRFKVNNSGLSGALFLCPKNCIYQFYDVSLQRSHHQGS